MSADMPPPPGGYTPPPPPPSGGSAQVRPGVVTAASVLLVIGGALAVLIGILLLGGAGRVAGTGVGGVFAVIAVIELGVGALQIYSGVQVLKLREVGRKIGVVMAGISAFFLLISIGRTPAGNVIGLAIDAFIIWALVTNASLFTA